MAVSAQRAGVYAVFAYDHLFRTGIDGVRRPAIECFALMAAVAGETRNIKVGSMVVRASLRPAAVVAANVTALVAVAGGTRLIMGIGAGDSQSVAEHDAFGIPFPQLDERVAALRTTAAAVGVAAPTVPRWIAGTHHKLRSVAAEFGGLNVWGASPDQFAVYARELHDANPDAIATWGGLVVFGATDDDAHERARRLRAPSNAIVGSAETVAQQLRRYEESDAEVCVLAPVDASNAYNPLWCAVVQENFRW